MTSTSIQPINITLAPGPLGVGITKNKNGQCQISSKANQSSPLEINDIIISLNGIKLAECDGGVNAWVTLFGAFGSGERKLVVYRAPVQSQNKNNGACGNNPQQLPAVSSAAASSTGGGNMPMVVDTVPSSLAPSGNGAAASSASSQQNNMSGAKQTFNGHHDIYAKAAGKFVLVLLYHVHAGV